MSVIPVPSRLRQEDCESKNSLDYIVWHCFKETNKSISKHLAGPHGKGSGALRRNGAQEHTGPSPRSGCHTPIVLLSQPVPDTMQCSWVEGT
jgi:hypothetical protein